MASCARLAVGAHGATHLQRLGAAARRPAAPREAAERRRDVGRPCGRGCGAQVACGERRVARSCVSRRIAAATLWESFRTCQWSVLACLNGSDGVPRRVGLVRAPTERMHIVCGAYLTLKNVTLTR